MLHNKYTFLLWAILVSSFAYAQNITIYNISTLEPVSEVFIINKAHTSNFTSNKKGVAQITGLSDADTLIIQHPSFNRKIITLGEIKSSLNSVYLTEAAVDLGEFKVMANKRQQLENELPMMVVPITQKEIHFNNPQTSADLLAQSGEVFVQKSQMGGGSPMIRGFSANRVLIVVDNIRMNNAIFRGGNLQNVISIDPNTVASSEVVFGPGSVIYGSDALGGVMNFHTISPHYSFKKDSVAWMGDALMRYSSANNERTAHVLVGAGGEKLAALGSFTMSFYDDLVTGSKQWDKYEDFGKREWYQTEVDHLDTFELNSAPYKQVGTSYNQLNAMGKIKYQLTHNVDMELASHYSTTTNIPRYDRLITKSKGQPAYAQWDYGPQQWFLTSLSTNFEIANDAWDRAKIIAGYQYFNESRIDRKYRNKNLNNRWDEVNAYNLNLEFDKALGSKHTLFYGIEGVFNTVESYAERTNVNTDAKSKLSTRYPDGGSYWANAAIYCTYQYDINKKWTFNTGLRYTYITLKSTFEDTTFYDFPFDEISLNAHALNGSFIGLSYKPNKKWIAKMNTSSGFRAPNIDDIAKVFDSEPGKVVVPNENLKPEFSYNTDLSFARKLSEKGNAEFTGFYTYLVNAMVRRDGTFDGKDSIMYDGTLSQVQMITNTGKAHIYGASVSIKANLTRLFGAIQVFTWTGGEDLVDKVPLRHVAPAFGKTSVFFKNEKVKSEFFVHYNAWRHWDELAPEEQGKPDLYTPDGTPAWVTLNVRASLNLYKKLELSAAIENILDQQYRPYSSGISAPGRNFIIALRGRI
ncbi:MAG: TonB-dependent receptor [Flavobacteriales bacterium]|nr:TonB-dependent receptor [Flavobacteriales bacterium]